MAGSVSDIDPRSRVSYDWDFFRLASQEEKLRYLAAQLFQNYYNDKSAVADFLNKLDGELEGYCDQFREHMLSTTDIWSSEVELPAVDHQSVLALPEVYDPELTQGLIWFFKSPRVVVLGGNDNDSSDLQDNIRPAGSENVDFLDQIRDRQGSSFVVRQDGDFYSLFSMRDGNKIRFSFDIDNQDVANYTKASAPELVDLKITNWCDRGCQFCFQASTVAGQHASLGDIRNTIAVLQEMKTFEVAIGGGEPTAHPDFATILSEIRQAKIVPNFTTYSNRWLDNKNIVDSVKENVGGIGVSCLSAKDIDLYHAIVDATGAGAYGSSVKAMVQHVVGSVPMHVTAEFLDAAFSQHIPVLLLGYKEVGFGSTYRRHDDADLETYLKLAMTSNARWIQLSVDTALIDQYPTLPAALGAPAALVSSPEGKFSCYVDAVTRTMGASSYVQKQDMEPLTFDVEEFKVKFAKY